MLPVGKIQRATAESSGARFTPSSQFTNPASQAVDIDSDGDDYTSSEEADSKDHSVLLEGEEEETTSSTRPPQAATASFRPTLPVSGGVGALMLRANSGNMAGRSGMGALIRSSPAPQSSVESTQQPSRQPSDELVLYYKSLQQTQLASPPPQPAKKLLVIGAPQCGKSTFINAYRTAVSPTDNWPLAPNGICGLYGTMSVEAYPNDSKHPTWLLIDTPGRVYDDVLDEQSYDFILLENLYHGVPWKTRLRGTGCLDLQQLTHLPSCPQNAPHQTVIVVSVADLIEDHGWLKSAKGFLLAGTSQRYTPSSSSSVLVHVLQRLIAQVRVLQKDAAPFVVVSHMDLVGGTSNANARSQVQAVLRPCCPADRIFFFGSPPTSSSGGGGSARVNVDGHSEMRRLHREIARTLAWVSPPE